MNLPVSPAGRRYGYIRTSEFHKPLAVRFPGRAAIPPSADLSSWCGPVKDQGDLGACTAFAGSGNREYLARKFEGRTPIFSPKFLYYQERALDGSLNEGDCGSTGHSSVYVMNQTGICLESSDAYDPATFQDAPTPAELSEAGANKAGAYHLLSVPAADLKSCIASGYPALVGFTVYDSFESDATAQSGVMPVPNKATEQVLGGHEVLFIGFDDSKQAFMVRNSWGTAWGQGGNFWFPYQCAGDSDVLTDAWIQHLGRPWV